ncbi:Nif3-like dinuclear metal center hexameric protein [Paenibacillus xylanexedens]|uniref:Nif3-like dinuclear metal center hexameric protein n=1 Tax=Paenibacillus xylanexedens TaxID=528191 RepID=UPI003CFEC5CE
MNVQQVMEIVMQDSCGDQRLPETGDVLVTGRGDSVVTGIVTTYMATVDVIRQAHAAGANLIITHEPTFYTGADQLDWIQHDPVYEAKRKRIEDYGMAIWRYHDYMHMAMPDRIYTGLLRELGWESKQVDYPHPWIYEIEPMQLSDLAKMLKQKLKMDVLQVVGRPDMTCSRIGILVGGGSLGLGKESMPMELMREQQLDVMICGEITEWTLCAYVNDATMLGMNKAMLVIGHERSEEWGMKHMTEWLQPLVGNIPVHFIDAKEPFLYL